MVCPSHGLGLVPKLITYTAIFKEKGKIFHEGHEVHEEKTKG
jgi:hypothetical protein